MSQFQCKTITLFAFPWFVYKHSYELFVWLGRFCLWPVWGKFYNFVIEEDMTSHLISLGVSSKRGRRSIPTLSESNLILNGAGLFGLGLQMTICPKDRRELRVDWVGRKRSTCSYPSHRGPRKQMKNVRRINISISEEVFA